VGQSEHPIGIFDSGVGGLSVLRSIRQRLPYENLIYIADQVNVPYGEKSLAEVRDLSEIITRNLISRGVKIIVVACNTASAAALHVLRKRFPNIPFVGMEPALKPAAERTKTGVIGVLATPATFIGELYASVVDRFAKDVFVLQNTCEGLVGQIETGDLNGKKTRMILEEALVPMLAQDIDTVVLGCTHYPFVIPTIQEIVGSDVQVIDPAPAIARQTERVIKEYEFPNPGPGPGTVRYLTSADENKFNEMIRGLLGEDNHAEHVWLV
jgi:glutamate racemase